MRREFDTEECSGLASVLTRELGPYEVARSGAEHSALFDQGVHGANIRLFEQKTGPLWRADDSCLKCQLFVPHEPHGSSDCQACMCAVNVGH